MKSGYAQLGLLLADGDVYAAWYREALGHAGLPYVEVERTMLDYIDHLDVLLLCGASVLSASEQSSIQAWQEQGGRLVVSGSTWGLSAEIGLRHVSDQRYSRARIEAPETSDRLWPDGSAASLFFGGERAEAIDGKCVLAESNGECLLKRTARAIYFGPHVGRTLSLMLMGRAVSCDAVGPGDDSIDLADGVLRAEDGTVFDYAKDRECVEGCPSPIFATPHADVIREIWIRAIVESIETCEKPFYLLWKWPDNAKTVATAGIDCDIPDVDTVMQIRRIMMNFGMRPAWMVAPPGLPADVLRLLRDWGHSIGLLYRESVDGENVGLRTQHLMVSRTAGSKGVSCVRPEDGRWQGYTRFYASAERAGSRLSLSKGGVQPGSVGYLFGTCQMFRPLRFGGEPFEIRELPYCAHLPGTTTPLAAIHKLISSTARVEGCFQFSLRVSKCVDQNSERHLQDTLMLLKQSRFRFFSPDELYWHDQARRDVWIKESVTGLSLVCKRDAPGFTLMLLGAGLEATSSNKNFTPAPEVRYGTLFTPFVINLEQKTQLDISFDFDSSVAA
ncbi:MAG: hypothetical protein IH944_06485 [Armatimonadetes bacterium]|nr:hypothetical protein [Armatimonadota bacterium]